MFVGVHCVNPLEHGLVNDKCCAWRANAVRPYEIFCVTSVNYILNSINGGFEIMTSAFTHLEYDVLNSNLIVTKTDFRSNIIYVIKG